MQVGLTGLSTTSAVGSLTVNDLTIGLTGLDATLNQTTQHAQAESLREGYGSTTRHSAAEDHASSLGHSDDPDAKQSASMRRR